MRRTPAEELCSFWILNLPSSPVRAACGPPQISLLHPSMLYTLTTSPYLDPNTPVAFSRRASSIVISFTFYRDIRRDCRVDEVLHRLLFLRRKRAREVEVKAQALCRDVAALLHDGVVAQHLFEPGEQQVRRRVQARGRHARIRKAALKTLLRAGVRFLLMLAEGFLIARFIHGKALFRRQFLCKFDRESERIVQSEGALARDFLGL